MTVGFHVFYFSLYKEYITLPSPQRCLNYTLLPSYVKIYTPLPSPLIQNILENFSFPSPKRSLNYIPLPSYVIIYTLLPQYLF